MLGKIGNKSGYWAVAILLVFFVGLLLGFPPGGQRLAPSSAVEAPPAFAGGSQVSPKLKEEYHQKRDVVDGLVQKDRAATRSEDAWQHGLTWVAFGLTSLIAVIAAFFGLQPPPNGGGGNASAVRGASVVMGVLAAFASVGTGASEKLKGDADAHFKAAVETSAALWEIEKRWVGITEDQAAAEAIHDLQQLILNHR